MISIYDQLTTVASSGRYTQALEGYKRCIEQVPELPAYYLLAADVMSEHLDQPNDAFDLLTQAIALPFAQVRAGVHCDC